MRGADKLVLVVAVVVPLLVITLGWPTFVRWVAGPEPQPTPQVAGAAATSAAPARAAPATPRPTLGLPPTIQPRAAGETAPGPPPPSATDAPAAAIDGAAHATLRVNVARPTPAITAAPTAAAAPAAPTAVAAAGDPGAAVSSFYALVASHQFDQAAQLWSPRMRAAFPPQANIDQRFSATQSIRVQRADVLNQDQSQATVAVDLLEANAADGTRHYVGRWYLVRGASGWLLDQPELQAAP
jgi:cytoskeletal protein RodZ